MVGMGQLEPLLALAKEDPKFNYLIDKDEKWNERVDVWYKGVVTATANKRLSVGCGAKGGRVGPELGFGHMMGFYFDEPVVIIKASQGNRSLGHDATPPSSRIGFPKEGKFYKGWQYDDWVEATHEALETIKDWYPDYQGQGYEIAGFVWWQGHKDGGLSQRYYERHLVNFINDYRKEFKAPDAPFVVGTVGFGGMNISKKYKEIWRAQMAVSDGKKYPAFDGNVASVDTRPLGGGDYHYNNDGATYTRVGDALGRAMVELLEKQKAGK
jgi:alpha-galactosidase